TSRHQTMPRSLTTYTYIPSVTGVGTSGPLGNVHRTCDLVTSPRPPAFTAIIGRSRDDAMTTSPVTTGEATMRLLPSLYGFSPVARHSSLPLAGSCPVTTSAPVTTISMAPLYLRSAGVV